MSDDRAGGRRTRAHGAGHVWPGHNKRDSGIRPRLRDYWSPSLELRGPRRGSGAIQDREGLGRAGLPSLYDAQRVLSSQPLRPASGMLPTELRTVDDSAEVAGRRPRDRDDGRISPPQPPPQGAAAGPFSGNLHHRTTMPSVGARGWDESRSSGPNRRAMGLPLFPGSTRGRPVGGGAGLGAGGAPRPTASRPSGRTRCWICAGKVSGGPAKQCFRPGE